MQQPWDAVAEHVQFSAPLNLAALRKHVAPEAEILDLGCGYGRIAAQIVSAGFAHVRGYDSSARMIARATAEQPQILFRVADAATLPEADHAIDAVVTAALFTCIPQAQRRREIVAEVQRVLKPGGSVHGVEFLRAPDAASGAYTSSAGIAMWHFQPEELRELFERFTGWTSWPKNVASLSGTSATVLQFVAYTA
jgi:ubiquinone/menaquinone biosynthesis C-methylase UbiE